MVQTTIIGGICFLIGPKSGIDWGRNKRTRRNKRKLKLKSGKRKRKRKRGMDFAVPHFLLERSTFADTALTRHNNEAGMPSESGLAN